MTPQIVLPPCTRKLHSSFPTRRSSDLADELGAITGIFPLAFAATMVPVGVALDRYGVKPVSLVLLAISGLGAVLAALAPDRKSTRLNSSHVKISYAVFCLKKNRQNKI